MLGAIRHRGPDDEGVWGEGDVWLGQRRLSIIDLSPAGRQPMVSACGRFVATVNGEIYNFESLRAEIDAQGHIPWRGHSDSEVLLEAVARWGLTTALTKARGMFAMGLWDRQTRTVHLARDRFGEKPLYYSVQDGYLSFGSELTALETLPSLERTLDPAALSLFFRYGYIPAPHCVYAAVRKLPPGCYLSWRAGEPATATPYFSVADLVNAGRADPLSDPDGAVDALHQTLRDAVKDQMISDVPLGAFLSGGVDSSLIVALMQAVSDRPVKTFTLGFEEPEFNEAVYAKAVAAHLKTDHTEHYVTAADARAIVPQLGTLYDEPFADASQIPTYLISKMAREHVTVCLTGDAGDEMFAGYVRYPGVLRLWNAIRRLPLRGAASRSLAALPLGFVKTAMVALGPLARQYASRGNLGPAIRKAARWLSARDQDELFERTMTAWRDSDGLLVDPPAATSAWRPAPPSFHSPLERMVWRDTVDYLPGDILCKVDRAAMAVALETRVPLLDPRVAALAWRAPDSMKIRDGETKWLMRRVLDKYVPRDLIDRPKMGFSVPLHEWLTGELRGWAQGLLDPAAIESQGILKPRVVAQAWRQYIAGDSSLDHQIWTLLMFQSWIAARGR